tara:strand:- start:16 stop:714 length:699 start_codon:yes stop_codon:yes gene_type:complete
MREIVLDTETTGLNVEDGHRVIEIGACEMIDHVLTGKSLHIYLNPERQIDKEAMRVHGINDEFLIGKPKFSEICEELLSFLGDSRLIIHNSKFDLSFLNNELILSGTNKIIENEIIDTLIIAKKLFPGSPVNLDSLCRRYNINLTTREEHGALIDSMLLAEVYIELIGGKQTSLVFNEMKMDSADLKANFQIQNKKENKTIKERVFNPSNEEKEKHKEFFETFKNPIWKKYL